MEYSRKFKKLSSDVVERVINSVSLCRDDIFFIKHFIEDLDDVMSYVHQHPSRVIGVGIDVPLPNGEVGINLITNASVFVAEPQQWHGGVYVIIQSHGLVIGEDEIHSRVAFKGSDEYNRLIQALEDIRKIYLL